MRLSMCVRVRERREDGMNWLMNRKTKPEVVDKQWFDVPRQIKYFGLRSRLSIFFCVSAAFCFQFEILLFNSNDCHCHFAPSSVRSIEILLKCFRHKNTLRQCTAHNIRYATHSRNIVDSSVRETTLKHNAKHSFFFPHLFLLQIVSFVTEEFFSSFFRSLCVSFCSSSFLLRCETPHNRLLRISHSFRLSIVCPFVLHSLRRI